MEEHGGTNAHPFAARGRMAYKPAALRSLDVCLDLKGPFIDAFSPFFATGAAAKRRRAMRSPRASRPFPCVPW